MKQNRYAIRSKIHEAGGAHVVTAQDGPDGEFYEVYLSQEEGRVYVIRLDSLDDHKGVDIGPISRKRHSEVCDLVVRAVQALYDQVIEAMEPAEISAQ